MSKIHLDILGRDACGFAAWTNPTIAKLGWYKKLPASTPQITTDVSKVTCGHCRKIINAAKQG